SATAAAHQRHRFRFVQQILAPFVRHQPARAHLKAHQTNGSTPPPRMTHPTPEKPKEAIALPAAQAHQKFRQGARELPALISQWCGVAGKIRMLRWSVAALVASVWPV